MKTFNSDNPRSTHFLDKLLLCLNHKGMCQIIRLKIILKEEHGLKLQTKTQTSAHPAVQNEWAL